MKLLSKAVVIGFLTVTLVSCTIYPNHNKDKSGKKEKKHESKEGPVSTSVFDRGLVSEEIKRNDVVKEHGLYYKDTNTRNWPNEVLGYITPWNANGYKIATLFHGKFTMISPVWFNLHFSNTSKFHLQTHDVKTEWLKEMRDKNTEQHTVKIMPRIMFENWSAIDAINLYTQQDKLSQLISALLETAKTFHFDGYVLELWNQLVFAGANTPVISSIVKAIGGGLQKHKLDIILAVPPSRGPDFQLFISRHLIEMSSHVKYFSLMTYDFSSVQRPGPNSPLEWSKDCVEELILDKSDKRRSQILMGLNFYGNHYTTDGGGAIVGSQYIKLLEGFKGKFHWDGNSAEHFFDLKGPKGNGYVFYPTLYSIKKRLDLAEDLGVGVAIWEIGQGLNFFYDLL